MENNSNEERIREIESLLNDLEEDLDFELLDQILDYIGNPSKSHQQQTTSSITELYHSDNTLPTDLLYVISKIYRITKWNKVGRDLANRPLICTKCPSYKCEHVREEIENYSFDHILDRYAQTCTHKYSNDWLLDNICSECLINVCQNIETSPINDIKLVWDSHDFAEYHIWRLKLDIEHGFYN